jgi:hypothetical protein
LDLTEAGTVAAMAALVDCVGMVVVGSPTVVVGAPAVVVVELLELLLQAAASTATAPMAVATMAFRYPRCMVRTIQPPVSIW